MSLSLATRLGLKHLTKPCHKYFGLLSNSFIKKKYDENPKGISTQERVNTMRESGYLKEFISLMANIAAADGQFTDSERDSIYSQAQLFGISDEETTLWIADGPNADTQKFLGSCTFKIYIGFIWW
eukprot:UN12435